jgi:hypothetical protein
LHPADGSPALGFLASHRRNVVLSLACHNASLAAGTTIQVYNHSPQRHVMPL